MPTDFVTIANANDLTHRELAAVVGNSFNINNYGAVGDGVTDDSAAIDLAVAAAVSAGGGTVVLSIGTYRIDSIITILSSNIEIQINGSATLLAGPALSGLGTSNGMITFGDGTTVYNKLKVSGSGVIDCAGVAERGLSFLGPVVGVVAEGISINNNTGTSALKVFGDLTNGINASKVVISGISMSNVFEGPVVSYADDVVMINNNITVGNIPSAQDGLEIVSCNRVLILSNTVIKQNITNAAIDIFEDNHDVIISANTMIAEADSSDAAIDMFPGLNIPTDISITNNLISGFFSTGIKLSQSNLTFTFAPADVNVTNNTITQAAHGLRNGYSVVFTSDTTLPTGIEEWATYFVIVVDVNTFSLEMYVGAGVTDITTQGVGVHTLYPDMLGISLDNNTMSDMQSLTTAAILANCEVTNISSNTFKSIDLNCIDIGFRQIRGTLISDNSFYNWKFAAIKSAATGTPLNGSQHIISFNTFSATPEQTGTGGTQRFIANSSGTPMYITGNNFIGTPSVEPIQDRNNAAYSYGSFNFGSFVTTNFGVGQIAGGTTSDVITHGVNFTPRAGDINLAFSGSTTAEKGSVWISNITTTSFTVNCAVDPVSNADFDWKIDGRG